MISRTPTARNCIGKPTRIVFTSLPFRRSPLRASVYAAIINSILDPLLIFNPPFGLGWGVGGAAGATVVAQLVAFYSLFTTLLPWLRHGPGSSSSARLNEDMDAPNKSDAVAGLEGDAVKVRPLDTDALVTGVGAQPSEQAAAETIEMPPRRRRKPRQWLHRVAGQRSRGEAKAKKIGGHSALRTIGATLVRSSSVLGTWVFITSTISRRLGADAIAAHGKSPSGVMRFRPCRVRHGIFQHLDDCAILARGRFEVVAAVRSFRRGAGCRWSGVRLCILRSHCSDCACPKMQPMDRYDVQLASDRFCVEDVLREEKLPRRVPFSCVFSAHPSRSA